MKTIKIKEPKDLTLTLGAKITPPPTKQDVLLAAAVAHQQKLIVQYKAETAEWVKQRDALMNEVKTYIIEHCQELCVDISFNSWSAQIEVPLDKLPPAMKERIVSTTDWYPKNAPSVESIVQELKRRANSREHVVRALLDDESVKEKLTTLAENLLKKPTTEDMSKAVNV